MASIRPHYNPEGKLISFYVRVFRGRDSTGKELKPYSETFPVSPTWNEKTAWKKAEVFAADFEAKCKAGTVSETRQTFQEYCDYVIKVKEDRGIRPTTIYNYRELTKRIYPEIGHIKLKDLTAKDLNDCYSKLSESENKNFVSRAVPKDKFGSLLKQKGVTRKELSKLSGVALHTVAETVNGKETSIKSAQAISDVLDVEIKKLFELTNPEPHTLSGTTVNACHRLIHTVLKQAVREGVIPYNVAERVDAPRKEHKDPLYYEFDQIAKIRQELESVPLKWRTIVCLFLSTGCRRGEICGLKWDAVDLEKKQIDIQASLHYVSGYGVYIDEPKTKSSKRKLTIPDEMAKLLEQYREWQNKEKERLGELFQDEGYLFTRDEGQPMNPESINNWMKKLDERCGFHVRPHAFRHSVATVLLFSGLDTVSTSKHLGHKDVSTTIDTYAHVLQQAESKSAEILSSVVFPKNKNDDSSANE